MKNKKVIIIIAIVVILLIIGAIVLFTSGGAGKNNWKLTKSIGLSGEQNISKQPEIGDIITLNNESFYIIKIEGETVSALAAKKVDQTTNLQTDLLAQSQFDDETNVYEGSLIQGYVNNYVATTLENKATGRLMTLDEVIALNADRRTYSTENCPEWINKIVGTDTGLGYWLQTPDGKQTIWAVNGKYSDLSNGCFPRYIGGMNLGVRPVVEVQLSEIK